MNNDSKDVAMDFGFEHPLEAQPSKALSKKLDLKTKDLQDTIQDIEDIELINYLFPNHDWTLNDKVLHQVFCPKFFLSGCTYIKLLLLSPIGKNQYFFPFTTILTY